MFVMVSVTQRIDEVISATAALRDIRSKIAEIEEERSILEDRAQRILESLASAATEPLGRVDRYVKGDPFAIGLVPPGRSKSLTERVLDHLAENSGREYGATELAAALGLSGESAVNTIRGTLSRLTAEGRISKVGYGKYHKRQEGKDNRSPISK